MCVVMVCVCVCVCGVPVEGCVGWHLAQSFSEEWSHLFSDCLTFSQQYFVDAYQKSDLIM